MKKFITLSLLSLIGFSSFSQKIIQRRITVSDAKTTFLIFDDKVDYFDLGSSDVGLKRTEKDNIIKIKAFMAGFRETNLTVMTSGGQYYSLLLNFSNNPDTLNYFFSSNETTAKLKSAKEEKMVTKNSYQQVVERLLRYPDRSIICGNKQHKMTFLVRGIHIKNDKLFFHTEITNHSTINYDIDFLKFSIKNTKRYKKTVSQETEMKPLFTSTDSENCIKAESVIQKIFVFDKFTVPQKKEFVIDLWEKDGDRNLAIAIDGKSILDAKMID
ncbi:MAG: conjugative transposon protein TraN [Thiothrix sp.]|nr:MAG: conjugative transposon protein TraN [Thiothrix sp.]